MYDAPPAIPSINTKFSLSKTLDFRVAYAYGFRSPALRELYFSFHDTNHDIDGNPNLKAEHSNSFNASFNWAPVQKGDTRFGSVLSGFYNIFNNQIDLASTTNGVQGFPFFKGTKYCNFTSMAKATKKSAKEASELFHNIMAASVKGNPKRAVKAQPKKDKTKKK